jgi:outer membrane protein
MKKFSIVSICAFLISVTTLVAQDQTAGKLTLQQAIEIGIKNNLDVQQSNIQAETDKINYNQAKMNIFPDLNGSISGGLNLGRSIDPTSNSYINQQANVSNLGLNSGVVLFNGFYLQNTIKQNALAYQASKMDWQQTKDNITINIILAYLQVLSSEDQLAQTRNQVALSKTQVDRLVILDNDGAIQPSLLSDLRGQYANDQLSIITAENTLETARIALAQLMNVPNDKTIQLERINAEAYATKYEATPGGIYETALQQFAQIKAVDLRRESAIKGLKAARGTLFPTLSLNGSVNTNYSSASRAQFFPGTFTDSKSGDYVFVNGTPSEVFYRQPDIDYQKVGYTKQLNNNLFNSISLNLQIPFFNNFLGRNRVKLAKLTVKNNELIAQTTKTRLQQAIDQAYVNMTTAADRYKTLLEQVAAYKESFTAAEARFNSGVGNSIDYLTAKNNLDRSNINSITAKYDYVLRTKILDYYQGKQLW